MMTLAPLLLVFVAQSSREDLYKEPTSTAMRSLYKAGMPRRSSSSMTGKGFYGGGLRRSSRVRLPSSRRGTAQTASASYVAVGSAALGAKGPGGAAPPQAGATVDFASALRALLPAMTPQAQGAGGTAPAAAPAAGDPTKWDLLGLPAGPRVPNALLERLSAGPLTDAEAAALVEQLAKFPSEAKAGAPDVHPELARLHASTPDPDLQTLQAELEALNPLPATGSGPAVIDGAVLRAWFQSLDVSRDAAVSFLEWRDRTTLPLDLFRRIDVSAEGQLSFEEFSRAMLLNSARAGGRPVDPALLEWAVGIEQAEAGAEGAATDVEALSQDELMRRAREELTAAAQLLRLDAAMKARTTPAPGGPGAAANGPANAGKAGAAAAAGRPTPVRVLFQKSRARRPAPPKSAFQSLKAQRAKARE